MKRSTLKGVRIILDRKAISPVLSSLLLTVVAVSVMSIATTATYVITSNLRENMSERIAIEDLWFNGAGQRVSIYLHNIGKVVIHVSAVYVNHTSQQFTPLSLELGKHAWLNVTFPWTDGSIYYVDVVTTRGTHIADYYKTV